MQKDQHSFCVDVNVHVLIPQCIPSLIWKVVPFQSLTFETKRNNYQKWWVTYRKYNLKTASLSSFSFRKPCTFPFLSYLQWSIDAWCSVLISPLIASLNRLNIFYGLWWIYGFLLEHWSDYKQLPVGESIWPIDHSRYVGGFISHVQDSFKTFMTNR